VRAVTSSTRRHGLAVTRGGHHQFSWSLSQTVGNVGDSRDYKYSLRVLRSVCSHGSLSWQSYAHDAFPCSTSLARALSLTHTHTHTYTHIDTHTRTHTHTHTHAHTHAHAHRDVREGVQGSRHVATAHLARSLSLSRTYTHTNTNTQTHTHTHKHTHTHTHSHTHTHTYVSRMSENFGPHVLLHAATNSLCFFKKIPLSSSLMGNFGSA